jgi:hypothetical protein
MNTAAPGISPSASVLYAASAASMLCPEMSSSRSKLPTRGSVMSTTGMQTGVKIWRTLGVEVARRELRTCEHRRAKALAGELEHLREVVVLEHPVLALLWSKEPAPGQHLERLCTESAV